MRAVVQIFRQMHERTSVRGRLGRLEPGDFYPQIGECGFALTGELGIRWNTLGEHLPWHGEAFAVDEVGGRRTDVRLDGGADRQ